MKRRCGWVPTALESRPRVVWTHKGISTETCPVSFITAQSIGWVEEFFVWKRLRLALPYDLSARQAEAFLILEEQLSLERQDATE
ncbi:MAG TPA: hypothetical protein VEU11_06110 [Terriglobales bacterium]|nr:hypothetical protein [Terriglobales bacterium]